MYAEYTRPQLTFLALHPCIKRARSILHWVFQTRQYDWMDIEYNVVPARIMHYLEFFIPVFFKRFNCRTCFIIPCNEQYKSKLRWFSAAYIFKPLSFFLMHFIVPMGFQGESLLFLIYILDFKCCFQNANFSKIKILRNFSNRHFFFSFLTANVYSFGRPKTFPWGYVRYQKNWANCSAFFNFNGYNKTSKNFIF